MTLGQNASHFCPPGRVQGTLYGSKLRHKIGIVQLMAVAGGINIFDEACSGVKVPAAISNGGLEFC